MIPYDKPDYSDALFANQDPGQAFLAKREVESPELATLSDQGFDFGERFLRAMGVANPERVRQYMLSEKSPTYYIRARRPGMPPGAMFVPEPGGGGTIWINPNARPEIMGHEQWHGFQNMLDKLRWDPEGVELTPMGIQNRLFYEQMGISPRGEIIPQQLSDPGYQRIKNLMDYRRSLLWLLNQIPRY